MSASGSTEKGTEDKGKGAPQAAPGKGKGARLNASAANVRDEVASGTSGSRAERASGSVVFRRKKTSTMQEKRGPKPQDKYVRANDQNDLFEDMRRGMSVVPAEHSDGDPTIESELYFIFLRYLGIAMALWTSVHFPVLCFMFNCDRVQLTVLNGLARSTAYNLGKRHVDSTLDTEWSVFGLVNLSAGNVVKIMIFLDTLGLTCFLAIMATFCYRVMPRKFEKFNAYKATAAKVSVEVSGIPPRIKNHAAYEEELCEHLRTVLIRERKRRRFSPPEDVSKMIRECQLARNYNGRLLKFQKLDNLDKKLDAAKEHALQTTDPKAKKEYEQKAADLAIEIAKARSSGENPVPPSERDVCVRAFVMFESALDKEILLDAYRFGSVSILRAGQHESLRFQRKHALKVVSAPEPENIMWENQDRIEWEVHFRKAGTLLSILLMFVISITLVLLCKTRASKALGDVFHCEDSDESEVVTIRAMENWNDVAGSADAQQRRNCLCKQVGYRKILFSRKVPDGFCADFMNGVTLALGFLGISTAVLLIVNLLLKQVIYSVTMLERPLNLSHFHSSVALRVFLALFINTALIIPLANMTILETVPPFSLVLGDRDNTELSSDFDQMWYLRIGQSLLLTQAAKVFSPHGGNVCMFKLRQIFFPAWLEDEMSVRFDLSYRVAELMSALFTAITYSAGMPLMTSLAMLTVPGVYLVDSYLLRWLKMPPVNDQSVFHIFKDMLPLAGLLHVTAAIFMFGENSVFPLRREDPQNPASVPTGTFDKFWSRGTGTGALALYLFAWVIGLAIYLCKLVKFLGGDLVVRIMAAYRGNELSPACLVTVSTLPESRKHGVWSYAPESHPDYARIIAQANDFARSNCKVNANTELKHPTDKDTDFQGQRVAKRPKKRAPSYVDPSIP